MEYSMALLAGLVCAGLGGEFFVRGAVGLAHWLRIAPGIIGATVAAFATSSPELSVSISSALDGTPQIALGDALGSNVVNIALILALVLLISDLHATGSTVKRDFPIALIVPIVTGALFLDSALSRVDGLLLLGIFLAWLFTTVNEARAQRSAADQVLGAPRGWVTILLCLAGLSMLIGAGHLIVVGAKGLAIRFGIDEFVVGATVVALGTSTPELATALIARLRGHDEVGLGTLLGSNIFNGLFIVPVAAVIHPIAVDWHELTASLAFGLVAVAFTFPGRDGRIERRRGAVLLAIYATYLAAIL